MVGLSPSIFTRLGKYWNVSMGIIGRICEYFNCDIGEIVEFKEKE